MAHTNRSRSWKAEMDMSRMTLRNSCKNLPTDKHLTKFQIDLHLKAPENRMASAAPPQVILDPPRNVVENFLHLSPKNRRVLKS